jgi:tripartite-type tricarboxylate transporter receptor subunit TctC
MLRRESSGLVKQRQARPLVQTAAGRGSLVPESRPSGGGQGLDIVGGVACCLFFPASGPAPIRVRLEGALEAMMADPGWQAGALRLTDVHE